MNGIVLYVDLLGLEAVADRYNQIDMQMKALLSSYESSISYLKESEYRGEIPPNILRVHNAEMQEIEERIRSLQSCLRSVLDIYRAYEKDFHTREMGNLYETTPIYKTNGFKIGVGVAVAAGCAVLAVVAFPGVAVVTGAAVGSAIGAVSGGFIGGITAETEGGSFIDGFAEGMLVGAIGGAFSGAVGEATATAGIVVSMVANGVTDSAIYAGETAYRGGEIKAQGLAVSFLTGAVLSGVTRISVGKYGKSQRIESGKYSAFGEMPEADGVRYRDWNYEKIHEISIHNANADSMTLGKYFNGTIESGSYVARAELTGDTYFSLGTQWNDITNAYGLSDMEMFNLFNTRALDDAVRQGKSIRFSQNPLEWKGTALGDEWSYLQSKHSYTRLKKIGDYWYAK
ncbi:MAG: hypothetical protein MR010_03525 [Lachnospiraceae bacterium]|nr:hypothetical protein [Lachnospiraceae bacterium]